MQIANLQELTKLGAGQAESEGREEFILRLYPVTEHLRAFDPDVVLVRGDRGTGKSELFNAVFKHELLPDLARYALELRLPYKQPERIHWLRAYPVGTGFPDFRGLRAVLTTPEQAIVVWFAYLVREVKKYLDEQAGNILKELFMPLGGSPEEVILAFNKLGNEPLLALDRLNEQLKNADKWLFVGYDELDTLGGPDWRVMARAVEGLVAFWANYSRRWDRLRAKIFIRSDIFRRYVGLGGADVPKLAANSVELEWSDVNLFSMLIKRIANTSDGLHSYCKKAYVPFKRQDSKFGFIPDLKLSADAKPLIELMAGPYMGANANKGKSYNWVLDHLRDGKGRVVPRSLVRLIEIAAQKEKATPRADFSQRQLLHPTSLRQALEDVSLEHVKQAMQPEWPWMFGLNERLANKGPVPWEDKKQVEKFLKIRWNKSWGILNDEAVHPPSDTAEELISYLIDLGVFKGRSDGRLDVPDIYLFGLGLRRMGGVRRT